MLNIYNKITFFIENLRKLKNKNKINRDEDSYY